MSLITKIVLGLIALHLIVGFGWLMYKLSPRKKESDNDRTIDKENPDRH